MKEGRTTWAKNDLASAIILRDPPKTPVRVSEPKSNTRYHRFLWKEEDDEEITANQTNRLTAGDRPSLFIAIKTLEDTSWFWQRPRHQPWMQFQIIFDPDNHFHSYSTPLKLKNGRLNESDVCHLELILLDWTEDDVPGAWNGERVGQHGQLSGVFQLEFLSFRSSVWAIINNGQIARAVHEMRAGVKPIPHRRISQEEEEEEEEEESNYDRKWSSASEELQTTSHLHKKLEWSWRA